MGAEESKPAEAVTTDTSGNTRFTTTSSDGKTFSDLTEHASAGRSPTADADKKEGASQDHLDLTTEITMDPLSGADKETASSNSNKSDNEERLPPIDVDRGEAAATRTINGRSGGNSDSNGGPLPNGVALQMNSPMVTIMRKSLSPSSSHEHYFLSPSHSEALEARSTSTAITEPNINQSKRRNILPKPPPHSGSTTPSLRTGGRSRNNVWSITKDTKNFYGWGSIRDKNILEREARQEKGNGALRAPVEEVMGESDGDTKKKLFVEEQEDDKNNTQDSTDSDDVQQEQTKDFSASSCDSGLWNASKQAAHEIGLDETLPPPKSINCPSLVEDDGEGTSEGPQAVSRLNSPTSQETKHTKVIDSDSNSKNVTNIRHNNSETLDATKVAAVAAAAATKTTLNHGMNGFRDVSYQQNMTTLQEQAQVAAAAAAAAVTVAATKTKTLSTLSSPIKEAEKEHSLLRTPALEPPILSRRDTEVASNVTRSNANTSVTTPSNGEESIMGTSGKKGKSRISVKGSIILLTIISLLYVRYHSFMRSLSTFSAHYKFGEIADEETLEQQLELYRKEEMAGYAFVGLFMSALFILMTVKIVILRFAFSCIRRGKQTSPIYGVIQILMGSLIVTVFFLMDVLILYYFLFEFNESAPQIDLV